MRPAKSPQIRQFNFVKDVVSAPGDLSDHRFCIEFTSTAADYSSTLAESPEASEKRG